MTLIRGHVLLAEDDSHVRWLVEEFLRRAGATVVSVGNGLEAVRMMRVDLGGAAAPAVDLVLMDIHMPEMDGPEAMREIRAAGFKGPIVAMTGERTDEKLESWNAAGCDAVANKPIDRQTFIPSIARLIEEWRAKQNP